MAHRGRRTRLAHSRDMRTDEFWAVIERARAAEPTGPADVARRAADELAQGDPDRVVAWARHLDKVMAASSGEDLWAAAYLINGGCSDEGFDSFRGWLVAQGRQTVAAAVREPDSLASLPAVRAAANSGAELTGDEVLAIPAQAYRAATSGPLPAGA